MYRPLAIPKICLPKAKEVCEPQDESCWSEDYLELGYSVHVGYLYTTFLDPRFSKEVERPFSWHV